MFKIARIVLPPPFQILFFPLILAFRPSTGLLFSLGSGIWFIKATTALALWGDAFFYAHQTIIIEEIKNKKNQIELN
ncbi:MAG: hypothetical protein HQM16_01275 [Deltaproteobacteria bacterium]|nr:hypothetical protein [Deltaproteobacteria bacterium]